MSVMHFAGRGQGGAESSPLIARLTQLYATFDGGIVDALDSIYHPEVVFQDPVDKIVGLEALRGYFAYIAEGVDGCGFEFLEVLDLPPEAPGQSGRASLVWVMRYRHPQLARGQWLSMPGMSHIHYGERIHWHRDYYDLGDMLYEHVPLLGPVVRRLRKRLAHR